jgi:four helix bundle protein
MEMSEKISSFKDLRVYKLAFELNRTSLKPQKAFQRKSAMLSRIKSDEHPRSIGANLSEAWQKRLYVAHFVSKLTDADGEQAETQHWLDTATACNYVSEREQDALLAKC